MSAIEASRAESSTEGRRETGNVGEEKSTLVKVMVLDIL